MSAKLTLRRRGPIGAALAAVARDIFGDARAGLADRRRPDSERIHEFRKTMKRWRALLRLMEPPIGDEANMLRKTARGLSQSLTRTRDGQSALDALDDIGKEESPLSPLVMANLRKRLEALKHRRERAALKPMLRRRLRRGLTAAERVYERWALDEVDFETIADGLTETYRRARRAIPDSWTQATAEEVI